MQYISAYALASLQGKQPTADTLNKILQATGKPVNEGEVKKVIDQFKGKNIDDLIKKGSAKVGSGGSAPQKEEKKQEKKQAKKQEKKQEKKDDKKKKEKEPQPEPQDDMGPGGLFD